MKADAQIEHKSKNQSLYIVFSIASLTYIIYSGEGGAVGIFVENILYAVFVFMLDII